MSTDNETVSDRFRYLRTTDDNWMSKWDALVLLDEVERLERLEKAVRDCGLDENSFNLTGLVVLADIVTGSVLGDVVALDNGLEISCVVDTD